MNSFKCVRAFQIEVEFGSVGFCGKGKTGAAGEKPLGARDRTNNKLNPHKWLQHQDLNWQATLVGGKCSHHCNTLSPLVLLAYCKWTKIGVTLLFSLMGFTVQCT